jgi:3-hydroxyacyl-[acyl-carrier-protein] dehydratase
MAEKLQGHHLSRTAIERILPHRGSFLFIHEATIIEPGKKATAPLVDLTNADYDFLNGHFPDGRINPGVIMTEAPAQLLGIAAASGEGNVEDKIGVLAEINKFRFSKPIFPTDKVMLEAEVTYLRRRLGKGHLRVLKGEEVAAEGDVTFVLVDREQLMAEMRKSNRPIDPPAENESQYQDILDKSTFVKTIGKDELARYEEVARSLGFAIEVVAEEGEYYLEGKPQNVQDTAKGVASFEEYMQRLVVKPVVSQLPVGQGQIAISIQKPPSEISHSSFLDAVSARTRDQVRIVSTPEELVDIKDPLVLREQIVARLSGVENSQFVLNALDFAEQKHFGQERVEGGPYIAHPFRIVIYMLDAGITDAVDLATAALHDVVEDTPTTLEEIEERFGPNVRTGVDLLSKEVEGVKKSDDVYFSDLLNGPKNISRTKVFDRIDNLYSWTKQKGEDERRRSYLDETRRSISPLAQFDKELARKLELAIEAAENSFGQAA